MNHIIITGASRGLGQELALQLADPKNKLHLIARNGCYTTARKVDEAGGVSRNYVYDLTNLDHLEGFMNGMFTDIINDEPDQIILVNNAGMLHPIGPIGKYDYQDYKTNLEVNYMVPAMLTHWIIHKAQDWNIPKRIMYISSGASGKPYYGWTHYCSTKAGIDMLMQTTALEQKEQEHPVEVAAFNPSRIETDMQKEIRQQSAKDFAAVEDFVKAKEDGRTGSATEAARKLSHLLLKETYPHGEIVEAKKMELP